MRVPYPDPILAWSGARLLLLLKDPDARAPRESNMVSFRNNDTTAARICGILHDLVPVPDYQDIMMWNATPWFEARHWSWGVGPLKEFLHITRPRAIVLFGDDAIRATASVMTLEPRLSRTFAVFPTFHPSRPGTGGAHLTHVTETITKAWGYLQ